MCKYLFLVCFCCLLLISSCATKKTSVPWQPDSKSSRTKASQKPYTVFGQRYEPMKSHEGFVQTGVASWYGKDFHGKKTSNGERYDMHAMTAAHKTLPLGVYVKVYHIKSGQETIVRVNDRGPFVKGRIIDLSYAAAKKLGVDRTGIGLVRIEALGYRQDEQDEEIVDKGGYYKEPATYDIGNYTVQIGSFKENANAVRLSEEMQKQHGFSDVRPTNIKGELFYRVYAGKYASLKEAEAAEQDFMERGFPRSFTVSLD